MKRFSFCLILGGLFCHALSPTVHATGNLLSQVQQANGTLIHQWDFSGATDGSRLMDTAGSAHLQRVIGEFAVLDDGMGSVTEVARGTAGSVEGQLSDVIFEPGFFGGQAYRPYYINPAVSARAGAALTGAGPDFASPTQFTIEAVVKAGVKTTASAVNYIFQTRPGSDRGYYLVQDESGLTRGDTLALGSIVGQAFGNIGHGELYNADTSEPWIYIAAVIDLSPIGAAPNSEPVTVSIYSANLSLGEATLTSFIKNDYVTNDTLEGLTGIFGVGSFAVDRTGDGIPDFAQEFFQGAIDSVAIYSSLLDQATLQVHLDSLLAVPEPTSFALLGIAGVLATGRRRLA
jgi:hypothetical protein